MTIRWGGIEASAHTLDRVVQATKSPVVAAAAFDYELAEGPARARRHC